METKDEDHEVFLIIIRNKSMKNSSSALKEIMKLFIL